MNTTTAKKIAAHRIKYVEQFINQFMKEWDGKTSPPLYDQQPPRALSFYLKNEREITVTWNEVEHQVLKHCPPVKARQVRARRNCLHGAFRPNSRGAYLVLYRQ